MSATTTVRRAPATKNKFAPQFNLALAPSTDRPVCGVVSIGCCAPPQQPQQHAPQSPSTVCNSKSNNNNSSSSNAMPPTPKSVVSPKAGGGGGGGHVLGGTAGGNTSQSPLSQATFPQSAMAVASTLTQMSQRGGAAAAAATTAPSGPGYFYSCTRQVVPDPVADEFAKALAEQHLPNHGPKAIAAGGHFTSTGGSSEMMVATRGGMPGNQTSQSPLSPDSKASPNRRTLMGNASHISHVNLGGGASSNSISSGSSGVVFTPVDFSSMSASGLAAAAVSGAASATTPATTSSTGGANGGGNVSPLSRVRRSGGAGCPASSRGGDAATFPAVAPAAAAAAASTTATMGSSAAPTHGGSSTGSEASSSTQHNGDDGAVGFTGCDGGNQLTRFATFQQLPNGMTAVSNMSLVASPLDPNHSAATGKAKGGKPASPTQPNESASSSSSNANANAATAAAAQQQVALVNPASFFEATQIMDSLYLGTTYDADSEDELLKRNIKRVLNVARECNPAVADSRTHNVRVKKIPLKDHSDEKIADFFDEALEFIREGIERGEAVLVHCRQGYSRSATFVLAYLMKYGVDGASGTGTPRSAVSGNNGSFPSRMGSVTTTRSAGGAGSLVGSPASPYPQISHSSSNMNNNNNNNAGGDDDDGAGGGALAVRTEGRDDHRWHSSTTAIITNPQAFFTPQTQPADIANLLAGAAASHAAATAAVASPRFSSNNSNGVDDAKRIEVQVSGDLMEHEMPETQQHEHANRGGDSSSSSAQHNDHDNDHHDAQRHHDNNNGGSGAAVCCGGSGGMMDGFSRQHSEGNMSSASHQQALAMGYQEAFDFVKRSRPRICPNLGFVLALHDLENRLRGTVNGLYGVAAGDDNGGCCGAAAHESPANTPDVESP